MISITTCTDQFGINYVECSAQEWEELVEYIEDCYQDYAYGDSPVMGHNAFRALSRLVRNTEKTRRKEAEGTPSSSADQEEK